jgi:hypothetical protein
MNVDLNALKEVAAAATPGPWNWVNPETDKPRQPGEWRSSLRTVAHNREYPTGRPLPDFIMEADEICDENMEANAAFIEAANPAAVLALIERLEMAEKIRTNGWIIHLSRWKERIDLVVDPKDRADMTELILKIDQAVMDMTARATPHLGRL